MNRRGFLKLAGIGAPRFVRVLAIILLCLVAVAILAQDRALRNAPGPDASLSVILGRPTDRSVTVSVLSVTAADACIEYGTESGQYREKTEVRAIRAGAPCEFEIGGLTPNTSYSYRLVTRTAGKGDFRPEPEAAFHTQRAVGSAFTFAVQGDSHPERPGKMYDPDLYVQTMRNVAKESPDFYVMMGDDFSLDHLMDQGALSQAAVDLTYAHQRGFLGLVRRSAALYLVNGNHEHADRCLIDGTENNAAVLAGRARTRYYPLPVPNGFYTGDAEEVKFVGPPRDYYAWTWGDALFVVIDFYGHSSVQVDSAAGGEGRDNGGKKGDGRKRDLWDVTLGETQYRWLTKTLTENKARWKFVFCHHVLGTGRGGVECASLCEWGGKNRNGRDEFAAKRPGWELPIHQLMVKTGVTIFFQGHDHLFARQELDGVVYQSCPNPADNTYQAFNRDAYRSGDILPNSGHLRVTVSPEKVAVDYVRSLLLRDENGEKKNGARAYSYTITARGRGGAR